jgi:hypothetical protein
MKKDHIDVKSYILSCQVLGVDPYTALGDIKKVYRSKVKELHPDVSAVDTSPKEFQRVQMAYEQILMFRMMNPDFYAENVQLSPETKWKKMEHAEKKQRRSKVKSELKVEYQAGRVVGVPKKHQKLERIIMHVNQIVVFTQWFVLPPLCIYSFGMDGIWMAIGVNIVGFFFTVSLWRNRQDYALGRTLSVLVRTLGRKK